jgi:hypothetical protein
VRPAPPPPPPSPPTPPPHYAPSPLRPFAPSPLGRPASYLFCQFSIARGSYDLATVFLKGIATTCETPTWTICPRSRRPRALLCPSDAFPRTPDGSVGLANVQPIYALQLGLIFPRKHFSGIRRFKPQSVLLQRIPFTIFRSDCYSRENSIFEIAPQVFVKRSSLAHCLRPCALPGAENVTRAGAKHYKDEEFNGLKEDFSKYINRLLSR